MRGSARRGFPVVVVLLFAAFAAGQSANPEPTLTVDQMRAFLLNAKIVESQHTQKGITAPYRLTLTDGKLTHDAGFQSVDEEVEAKELPGGRVEVNFVDSYRYDIAAYELAVLPGLSDMMPVTVERTWSGRKGALTWWLPAVMDEQTRQARKIPPPDLDAWNRQVFKKSLFAELGYDLDPNRSNVLISSDWHLWMIDFTRAFRVEKTLRHPKEIEEMMCSCELLERMRALARADVQKAVGKQLTRQEIDALMARRDKLVALVDQMVRKKGEAAVLFSDKHS
jgi:hypothetical protein